jgi:hypothetical protein
MPDDWRNGSMVVGRVITMLQPKILRVEPMAGYKLKLYYETGEQKLFDVSSYISGDWFGQLRDASYFRTVRVVSEGGGIAWANGQDITPHELYELSMDVLS